MTSLEPQILHASDLEGGVDPILSSSPVTPSNAIELTAIGTYETGVFDESAAEIVDYDPDSQRLFVVNANDASIDVLDASNPTELTLINTIDGSLFGGVANSVDIFDGIVAVAIENEDTQSPGTVAFFKADGNFELLSSVTVGALPDMLTFTPDGRKVLVANEGEPSDSYAVDPEGSISIIDMSASVVNVTQDDVTTAGFTTFNNQKDELVTEGVRIFGPDASVAQDFEPEYITISKDSTTAWIALQENNALGLLDIDSGEITDILPLGFKDHSIVGNGLDVNDADDAINIANWPVLGMYQPDAITSYEFNGETFIITANEGDSRDYDGFSEEASVADLELDPTAFPNATELQTDEALGRLLVTTANGDTNGDGKFEELYAFGGRSFSIWSAEGELVYDSGDDFEQIIATLLPQDFNSNNDENGSFDDRSDDKGPEPEGVTTGVINGRTYAFIGLERVGGIMAYDVTNPSNPTFVQYINNRDFSGDAEAGTAGDLGPEGLTFISAEDSPNGNPLLAVANEVSGTTTLFEIANILDGSDGQNTFSLSPGNGAYTISNFGGVGTGANPSANVIAVDTLQFTGEDLTAQSLLLTQEGSDLLIAFEGTQDIEVRLKNFDLEDLDNLQSTGASVDIGNILFDGQNEIQDSFDVFNADSQREQIFNANTVTFLNDLDNEIQGFGDSNDVINGQGGNDTVRGFSGDDILRGGAGNDRLFGGEENDYLIGDEGDELLNGGFGQDTLLGGSGSDRFVLAKAKGPDTILDFTGTEDLIELSGSLRFARLTIAQGTGNNEDNTLISIRNGELLAILSGVQSSTITSTDFFTI